MSTLLFYAQFTASKLGVDDLSPTIDITSILRSNAAQANVAVAQAMTQIALPAKRGIYLYRLAGADLTTFDYIATAVTSDSSVDLKEVPALWARFSEGDAQTGDSYARLGAPALASIAADIAAVDDFVDTEVAAILAAVDTEVAAIKTKTDQLTFTVANRVDATASGGGTDPLTNEVPGDYASGTAGHALGSIGNGQITTVSPVAVGGLVTLTVGDDYNATDGRSLNWTDTNDATGWPTLTSATITFNIGDGALSVTGSVVTATGSPKAVRAQPTAAQTATLTPGTYDYDVRAVLSNGRTVTLARGRCKVVDREDS